MKNITTVAVAILLLSASMMPASFAAAPKSKKCIVSGETFGGDNGPPIEVTAPDGTKLLLCCRSCVKKFNANPGKYVPEAQGKIAKK